MNFYQKLSIFVLLLLSLTSLDAQQADITLTNGKELMIQYSNIRQAKKVGNLQTVILYDIAYERFTVAQPFTTFMGTAGCNMVEFTDFSTGEIMAVPLSSIDKVRPHHVDTTGYIHSQLFGTRQDDVYRFRENYDSIKATILECSDPGGVSGVAGPVYTDNSVVGNGQALYPLQLENDEASPGSQEYYGTDTSGTKGFYPVPSAENTEAVNVGEGTGIFQVESGDTLYFRKIAGAGGASISTVGDSIVVTFTDQTVVQNIGSGEGVFDSMSGDTIQLKTLSAGANITITPQGDSLIIASTGGGGTGVSFTQSGNFQAFYTGASPPTYSLVSNTATITIPSGTNLLSAQINESYISIGSSEVLYLEVVDPNSSRYTSVNLTWMHNIQVVERDLLSGSLPTGSGSTFNYEAGSMALAQRSVIRVYNVVTGSNKIVYEISSLGVGTNWSILIR
jgi:hypothetical protein